MDYSKHVNATKTKQTNPIFGRTAEMVKNEAGGYGFLKDDWQRLSNFLILGSEGGTYYVGERELTQENAEVVLRCLREDGQRTVTEIVRVSHNNLAPKNDPAIFAIAMACVHGNEATKKEARQCISLVCRTGTHLFSFMETYKNLGGKTSRQFKKGVAAFYKNKTTGELALQLVKYRQRGGWTHKDVLRLAHPSKPNAEQAKLYRFAVGKPVEGDQYPLVEAYQALQKAAGDEKAALKVLRANKMPWETVPTELLNSKKIWEALLPNMGYTALIRNLGKLSSIGLLGTNFDDTAKLVMDKLEDREAMKKGRVHPFSLLLAYSVYMKGQGVKGSLTWKPISGVLEGLESAFFASMFNVEAIGGKTVVGVDISGSMTGQNINNTHLSAAEAALVMAFIHYKVEKQCELIFFDTQAYTSTFTKGTTIQSLLQSAGQFGGGGTDCSLPMKWAHEAKVKVDNFIIYTDSQTWAGQSHPTQALNAYNVYAGKKAKAVGVELSSTASTIADPKNPQMLSVVGMDASVPGVVRNFLVGGR